MILCARSTSRSREQSTKRRSRSESMRKVCLFYSQNNIMVWLSKMEDTFLEKCTRCAKVCGMFSWLCFSGADWLGRQFLSRDTVASFLMWKVSHFRSSLSHRHLQQENARYESSDIRTGQRYPTPTPWGRKPGRHTRRASPRGQGPAWQGRWDSTNHINNAFHCQRWIGL